MQFNILSTLALIILSYERHTKTTYRTVLLPFLYNQSNDIMSTPRSDALSPSIQKGLENAC